jgi:hypothetical protein
MTPPDDPQPRKGEFLPWFVWTLGTLSLSATVIGEKLVLIYVYGWQRVRNEHSSFCAYHNSVEPFQNVNDCQVRPGTTNGQLLDSTNSLLSHELIETITDPDGDAWISFRAVVLARLEIGDECELFVILPISPTQAAVFGDRLFFASANTNMSPSSNTATRTTPAPSRLDVNLSNA